MNNQETKGKTITEEVIDSLVNRTELLEKELAAKNEALMAKEKQTQALLADFESKFSNIVIQAPRPDLSAVTMELRNGLTDIKGTMEKWPKPLKKDYHFTFFPEQVRSVEYVRAVLTRVIICIITLVFLFLGYLLLNKP